MPLPNVWETCKFSDEIVSGVPDYSKFAVELHSVLDNSADRTYQDPSQFLNNTYLTSRMKAFLKDVHRKVERNEGSPVYVIDAEFGGGKTHISEAEITMRNFEEAVKKIKKEREMKPDGKAMMSQYG